MSYGCTCKLYLYKHLQRLANLQNWRNYHRIYAAGSCYWSSCTKSTSLRIIQLSYSLTIVSLRLLELHTNICVRACACSRSCSRHHPCLNWAPHHHPLSPSSHWHGGMTKFLQRPIAPASHLPSFSATPSKAPFWPAALCNLVWSSLLEMKGKMTEFGNPHFLTLQNWINYTLEWLKMVYEVVFSDLASLSLIYIWSPPIITHLLSSHFLSLLDG